TGSPHDSLMAHIAGLGPVARLDFERCAVAGEVIYAIEGDSAPVSQQAGEGAQLALELSDAHIFLLSQYYLAWGCSTRGNGARCAAFSTTGLRWLIEMRATAGRCSTNWNWPGCASGRSTSRPPARCANRRTSRRERSGIPTPSR